MVATKSGVGVVYGAHEMDSDTVSLFIAWLCRQGAEIGRILIQHKICSCEFNAAWLDISELMPIVFITLQNKFMGECMNGK